MPSKKPHNRVDLLRSASTALETTHHVEVFYSYAHDDEEFRGKLVKALSMLRRQKYITEWHDRKIAPGDEWRGQIDTHLDSAGIILLLISFDFLDSDYCYDVEMQHALSRHHNGTARVIPIVIRPCDWTGAPFAELQMLPTGALPVTSWPNEDDAFKNIAQGIRQVVERLQTQTPYVGEHIGTPSHMISRLAASTKRSEELLIGIRDDLLASVTIWPDQCMRAMTILSEVGNITQKSLVELDSLNHAEVFNLRVALRHAEARCDQLQQRFMALREVCTKSQSRAAQQRSKIQAELDGLTADYHSIISNLVIGLF